MGYIPVGVAYSLWCGFGIVRVTLVAMILYKTKPDSTRYILNGIDYLWWDNYEYLSTM